VLCGSIAARNNPPGPEFQSRLRDARELARSGRGAEAARLWMSALEIAPYFYPALMHGAGNDSDERWVVLIVDV
jgi:hypothetical protein